MSDSEMTEAQEPGRGPSNGPRGVGASNEIKASNGAPTGAVSEQPNASVLMQFARSGELKNIQRLFAVGGAKATDLDSDGSTALHWAASYNQLATCQYLLDQGADVNALGGESKATPALWAAHKKHFYIVGLLLRRGADPSLLDFQGFNMLHLSTFSNNSMQAVLLLHYGCDVDAPDSHLHTSLMWAAYNGFPQLVSLYLRWGARVDLADESGSTALHWALVKGDFKCIQKLIEYGSDRYLQTKAHKSPSIVAKEMNTTPIWTRALDSRGYEPDGSARVQSSSIWRLIQRRVQWIPYFVYFVPFLLIGVTISLLAAWPFYVGVFLAAGATGGTVIGLSYFLQRSPAAEKRLSHSSLLAGIFSGTLFWVGVRWLTHVLPGTFTSHVISNAILAISFVCCTYLYLLTMLGDPGYVPLPGSIEEQRATIEELLDLWRYDERNFCVHCMIRKPVRSKHCFRCKRCVARHDHHCPWINNCVAVNNHRQFLLYVIAMETGIIAFIRLAWSYFDINRHPPQSTCILLSPYSCGMFILDPFTALLTVWTAFQAVWVTMLVFVQLVQVARAQTTYENMALRNFADDSFASLASGVTAGTTDLQGAQLTAEGRGPDTPLPLHNNRIFPNQKGRSRSGWFAQCTKILGVDAFIVTAQDGIEQTKQKRAPPRKPFSRGVTRNLIDFFADPSPLLRRKTNGIALLGGAVVDYRSLYDPPEQLSAATRSGLRSTRYEVVSGEEQD